MTPSGNISFVAVGTTAGGNIISVAVYATDDGNIISVAFNATVGGNIIFVALIDTCFPVSISSANYNCQVLVVFLQVCVMAAVRIVTIINQLFI